MLELIYKNPKSANIEDLNIIDVFDKDNKVIDDAIVVLGDLISIKCYIRYWRHYTSKWHGLIYELATTKKKGSQNHWGQLQFS